MDLPPPDPPPLPPSPDSWSWRPVRREPAMVRTTPPKARAEKRSALAQTANMKVQSVEVVEMIVDDVTLVL